MIKNYIFDLYGTLIDIRTDESSDVLWMRLASFFASKGVVYASEELCTAYRAAVEKQIEKDAVEHPQIIKKHIEPDILAVFQSLYTDKNAIVDRAEANETALLFRRMSTQKIRLYPGAKKVLHELIARGKRTFILSNAQSAFTIPEIQRLGIISLFDGMVLSSEVGVKKPDKKIFDYILSKYGLYPHECLMIGNNIEDDMHGACSSNIAGLYIHSKQSPCHHEKLPGKCNKIRKLVDILTF